MIMCEFISGLCKFAVNGIGVVSIIYRCSSFSFAAHRICNKLPTKITESENLKKFKIKLKTYLFKLSYVELENIYYLFIIISHFWGSN